MPLPTVHRTSGSARPVRGLGAWVFSEHRSNMGARGTNRCGSCFSPPARHDSSRDWAAWKGRLHRAPTASQVPCTEQRTRRGWLPNRCGPQHGRPPQRPSTARTCSLHAGTHSSVGARGGGYPSHSRASPSPKKWMLSLRDTTHRSGTPRKRRSAEGRQHGSLSPRPVLPPLRRASVTLGAKFSEIRSTINA